MTILKRGASGPAAVDRQRLLHEAGHGLVLDGDFGPRTEAAVRMFQAVLRLAVEGVARPADL